MKKLELYILAERIAALVEGISLNLLTFGDPMLFGYCVGSSLAFCDILFEQLSHGLDRVLVCAFLILLGQGKNGLVVGNHLLQLSHLLVKDDIVLIGGIVFGPSLVLFCDQSTQSLPHLVDCLTFLSSTNKFSLNSLKALLINLLALLLLVQASKPL